jgi:hypothetical protein
VDSRKFGVRVFWGVAALCALLLAVDPLVEKHGHYAAENWIGAYGLYGFVSCVLLVLAAKELRKLIRRREDYYD